MNFDYAKDSKEQRPYEHYLDMFQNMNPVEISKRTGIPYDEKEQQFTLRLMGCAYHISHPVYEISHVEDTVGVYPLEDAINARILVLRYLTEGKDVPSAGEFLTYRDMPWGEVYFKQFQGRCLLRLAYGFGNKLQIFQEIMERFGAVKKEFGDSSYEFEFLDNLYLRLLLWEGDDEFPPSAQILFSDNFSLAFSAEDMAVVGDVSISLLKALEKQM